MNRFLLQSCGVALVLILLVVVIDITLHFSLFLTSGFIAGSLIMLLNIVLLTTTCRPLFLHRKQAWLAGIGFLSSWIFLGVSSYSVYTFNASWMLGLALGFASPTVAGLFYAYSLRTPG